MYFAIKKENEHPHRISYLTIKLDIDIKANGRTNLLDKMKF